MLLISDAPPEELKLEAESTIVRIPRGFGFNRQSAMPRQAELETFTATHTTHKHTRTLQLRI